MKTIWKYTIDPQYGKSLIRMRSGAEFLSAQMQGIDVSMWFMVDESQSDEVRQFLVVPTGGQIHEPVSQNAYLATVQDDMGLVWHVFEILKEGAFDRRKNMVLYSSIQQ